LEGQLSAFMAAKSSAWAVLLVSLLYPTDGFSVNLNLVQNQSRHPRTSSCDIDDIGNHRITLRHSHARNGISSLLLLRNKSTSLFDDDDDSKELATTSPPPIKSIIQDIQLNPTKAIYFSSFMTVCGATLGPFLDSYHSLFGVLTYNTPLIYPIIGRSADDAAALLTCVTTYWVPPLFGLAGFLIGWLYILLDAILEVKVDDASRLRSPLYPSIPKVLIGVSYFTFQYWLSGVLFANNFDRTFILVLMSVLAAVGYYGLDRTQSGLVVSAATAIGGPLIEIGLISFLPVSWAYHYNDVGETGYFPLWIIPVYFLGGPANGNLARAFWNALGKDANVESERRVSTLPTRSTCLECQGTRAVPCPNCDDGTYFTYGQRVICKTCRGKGRVICRKCFSEYGDDPNDIEKIRRIMDQIPD